MANEKFSDFTSATELDGTETLVGLKSGSNAQFPIDFLPITKKVSVSSAEILQLFTTPKVLIPSVGAGKVLIPIRITYQYTYGTDTYSNPIIASFLGDGVSFNSVGSTSVIANAYNAVSMTSPTGNYTPFTLENASLILSTGSLNPTVGDGTLDVYITYVVVNL